MNSEEIRRRFLKFFADRGHAIIPSASLVPENDPSVLFTTAGMQPLVPYLLGQEHPAGKRLVNVQKCVRTQDIDEVGDNTHDTFFEMLGNWSLGDYFKEDAIKWSYELLISKEEGFGLDPKRLYITVFEGNEDAPRDEESFQIWQKVGIPENRIYFMGAKSNWWSAGDNGPCGPDTEMFYDITPEGLGDLDKDGFIKADKDQKIVEIWNDVFMEYLKKDGKVVGKLSQQNVDTGAGLERLSTVLQGKNNIFDTDLFAPIMAVTIPMSPDIKKRRIIADHMRTAVFMITDGVFPSNTDRGYILRKLIRRAVSSVYNKEINQKEIEAFVEIVSYIYRNQYPEIKNKKTEIVGVIYGEVEKYKKTMDTSSEKMKKMFSFLQDKHNKRKDELIGTNREYKLISSEDLLHFGELTAKDLFDLHTQEGIDVETVMEYKDKYYKNLPEENRLLEKYRLMLKEHQELSRAGAEQKFKGGLADHSEEVVKYHTATHLLHQALHDVLGDEVGQKGSNLTSERLRFDFSFPRKLTDEEKQKVEDIVNEKIGEELPVHKIVLPKEEAEKTGAHHAFDQKYPDEVSVYYIGDSIENAYSKEFCGGPHVENIGTLGYFKIKKEESVSAGVRRIKAVLE